MGIADAALLEAGNLIEVEGYYVGVTREGASSIYEMVIKDLSSDTFLSVRNVPYGAFPDYGYKKGDRIKFIATVAVSSDTYTSGKKYLDFSADNGTIETTVISSGNKISYSLENAVTVSSWNQAKTKFTNGTIDYYTIVKFSGTTYFNYKYNTYRFHKVANSTSTGSSRITGTRMLSLRTELMEANVGKDLDELLGITSADTWPGASASKTFYALYTGGNDYYFDHIILDENWVMTDYEIVSVSDDGKTASVNVPAAGTYSVIFANFEEGESAKLSDCDVKTITVTESGRVNVTTDKNFTFGTNDKIMFWKDLSTLFPLCAFYKFE